MSERARRRTGQRSASDKTTIDRRMAGRTMDDEKRQKQRRKFPPAHRAGLMRRIETGNASVNEVRELLHEFCLHAKGIRRFFEGGQSDSSKLLICVVALPLIEFVAQRFEQYISGECKTLEQAFALTKRRGRPVTTDAAKIHIAVEVLKRIYPRLAPMDERGPKQTLDQAREAVAAKVHKSPDTVRDIYAEYKDRARQVLKLQRAQSGNFHSY